MSQFNFLNDFIIRSSQRIARYFQILDISQTIMFNTATHHFTMDYKHLGIVMHAYDNLCGLLCVKSNKG